jgi:putative selenate reductase
MVDLFCTPFADLIQRMRLEFHNQQSIFDLPARKWYIPPVDENAPDLSVRFHDAIAGNASGPASGPQTQMAQNLVLSWLAGGRIMELKTIQVNDKLKISRPCIDAANVGYNVEWSQELRVHESLDQYVAGAMLIHMLRHAPEVFGHPFGETASAAARHAPFGEAASAAGLSGLPGQPIYDMSIGYDLAGIRTSKVVDFIRGMIDARPTVERLRNEIPRRLAPLRDLDYPTALSRSITLSTFHGCPAGEIERICEFLLTELGVHVIVKMNPPMLGKERLEHLLQGVMGYTELRVHEHAYTSGLQFDESLEICGRLSHLAASRNLRFGAKFSNTLEVENHRNFFQPSEKVMYLSGAPLHVITLTLAAEFRRAMAASPPPLPPGEDRRSSPPLPLGEGRGEGEPPSGSHPTSDVRQKSLPTPHPSSDIRHSPFPISFSAGVDRKNFANLVACGFVPITTCTDLLKTGGYGRLPPYLHDLQQQMQRVGARTIDDFILDARGQRAAAADNPVLAGLLNTPIIAAETQADPRYHAHKNRGIPKKIDSHLVTFDCITCDKCIPVCPNDANFSYHTGETEFTYRDVEVHPDGAVTPVGEERTFKLEKADQIANYADYCNHCGNCDTFCPEYDGPYLQKPNFFGSRRAFDAAAPHDGFLVELVPSPSGRGQGEGTSLSGNTPSLSLTARILGRHYHLEELPNGAYRYDDAMVVVSITTDNCITLASSRPAAPHTLDIGRFHALATLLAGITNPTRIHAVNTPFLAAAPGQKFL